MRVALQCSKVDSLLILAENNLAAKWLSRPGEAIYNDANGAPEGNHFFQVVWLSDEKREAYLEQMQSLAVQRKPVLAHAHRLRGQRAGRVETAPSSSCSSTTWRGSATSAAARTISASTARGTRRPRPIIST